MTYTHEITLDLNPKYSAYPVIDAKQNDIDSRIIHVHYTADGEEYKVSTNSSVALRLRKPDLHIVFNDATVNYDGTVSVTLTQQCLASAGRAYADLVEFDTNGSTLSTVSFIINIMPMPDVMGGEAISSDEFLYLISFINQGSHIIGEAQEWANGYNGSTPVPSSNPAYHNNAKYWSEYTQEQGDIKIKDAEAWARGTRGGTPVPSSDQTYHNNSKYWSEESDRLGHYWADQAEASRQKIEDMTVSATQTEPDTQPTVIKTTQSGVTHLEFGIPKSNAAYVTFDVNYSDGNLYMFRPDAGQLTDELSFSVNATNGNLEVTFDGQ